MDTYRFVDRTKSSWLANLTTHLRASDYQLAAHHRYNKEDRGIKTLQFRDLVLSLRCDFAILKPGIRNSHKLRVKIFQFHDHRSKKCIFVITESTQCNFAITASKQCDFTIIVHGENTLFFFQKKMLCLKKRKW